MRREWSVVAVALLAALLVGCGTEFVTRHGGSHAYEDLEVEPSLAREPDGSVTVQLRVVGKKYFRRSPVPGQDVAVMSGFASLVRGRTNEHGVVEGSISEELLASSDQPLAVRLGDPIHRSTEWQELTTIRREVRAERRVKARAQQEAHAAVKSQQTQRLPRFNELSGPPPAWTRDALNNFRATLKRRGYLEPSDPAYAHAILAQASVASCLIVGAVAGLEEDKVIGAVCRTADHPRSVWVGRVLGQLTAAGLFADAFAVPEPVWARILDQMLREADLGDGPDAFARIAVPKLREAVLRVPLETRERVNEIARMNMLLRPYP